MFNIKRLNNELTQYGITPQKIISRLMHRDTPKVLANSIPKSGTNLLLRALYLFPHMHRKFHRTLNNNSTDTLQILNGLNKGQVCAAHLGYSEDIHQTLESNAVKNIIIVRDPRDIAVSNYIYITYKDTRHRLSNYFLNELHDDSQRIMASIQGISAEKLPDGIESLSLAQHYAGYMEWKKDPECLIVKFEDLIGVQGGGSEDTQIICLQKIVSHIGLKVNETQIKTVAAQIFNPTSRTFVKGQIGTWKQVLEKPHIEKIKESMGSYLIQLGYENDNNW